MKLKPHQEPLLKQDCRKWVGWIGLCAALRLVDGSGKQIANTKQRGLSLKGIPMEGNGVKLGLMLMVAVILVSSPSLVDGAFGIQLNPCTLPECIAECKKALQEKFLSATCASGSQGKFCICLG
ncbi:hypothetical protein V6N13_010098 [Hibiscus sabdariffa]